jgi:hypothetical protein
MVVLWIVFAAASCSRNYHTAIIYSKSADPLVTNGTAYDRATIDLGANTSIEVPPNAKIEIAEQLGKVTLLMEKSFDYFGHPGSSLGIDEVRKGMGCAYLEADGKLRIAKYGEFSTGEGGRFISLTVRVPKGIRVDRGAAAMEIPTEGVASSPLELHEHGNSTWCARNGFDERWTPVPGDPDHEEFTQHCNEAN